MKIKLSIRVGQYGGAQGGDVMHALAVHRLDLVAGTQARALGFAIGADAGDDRHLVIAIDIEGDARQRGHHRAAAHEAAEDAMLGHDQDEQQGRHDGHYADRKPFAPARLHGVTIRCHTCLFGRDHLPRHGDEMTFCSFGPSGSG